MSSPVQTETVNISMIFPDEKPGDPLQRSECLWAVDECAPVGAFEMLGTPASAASGIDATEDDVALYAHGDMDFRGWSTA